MSDKYFIDTNIFIYCFDEGQPEKKARALAIVAKALQTGNGTISWQVMQEFLNVATRKFAVPFKPEDAKMYAQKVLYPLCRVFPDLDLYLSAIDLSEQTGYSFYDALILAAAIHADCKFLYSEDFHTGQAVAGLTIQNPFA